MEVLKIDLQIGVLIYDLIMSETWKHKVYPLIKFDLTKITSIKSYLAVRSLLVQQNYQLYHEASVCNLLEIILYHRTACENSQDQLVELIDYCYRKFLGLTNW